MKIKLLFSFLLIITFSCGSDDTDDGNGCQLVDCASTDLLNLNILRDSLNIFETDPPNDVSITQNGESIQYNIDSNNILSLVLIDDDPIQININEVQLTINLLSTFIEGECCSRININMVTISNLQICDDDLSCNQVLDININ